MILCMSRMVCKIPISINDMKTWIVSLAALVYLGAISGMTANLLSRMVKGKVAVVLTFILFIGLTVITMKFLDVFSLSRAALFLNPITAVSLVEEINNKRIVLSLIAMMVITYGYQNLLAYVYNRKE